MTQSHSFADAVRLAWPHGLREEDASILRKLSAENERLVAERLSALLEVEAGTRPASCAPVSDSRGLTDSGFQSLVRRWRADRSIRTLMPYAGRAARTLAFRMREPTANGDLVDRIVLDERDVHKLVSMEFDRVHFPGFPFARRIKRQDVEELLNLKPKRFQQAWKGGEVRRGDDRLYDLVAMIALAEGNISGGEILARWSSDGRTLPKPFRGRRRLRRPRHVGWNRELVENVMAGRMGRSD